MVGSVLALSLLGLGAVTHALPASKTVAERQGGIWGIGSGSGSFGYGSGSLPTSTCLSNVPISEQPPCILAPITGGLNPPKEKRQGSSVTIGSGSTSPSDKEAAIAALQLQLLELQNKPDKTDDDLAQIAALQAMILYTEGITSISAPPGVGSTFTHGGKAKRFSLPPDSHSNTKHAIEELELELEQLQNKEDKTPDDYDEMKAIKSALRYLAGITGISAPPGSGSTFTPGKRFSLPPDSYSDTKHAIEELELELEQLQNKQDKTPDDYDEIRAIKSALKYLAGITSVSAPPGSGSTFTPGKRFSLPPDSYSNTKHAVEELELDLEQLQNKDDKTPDDYDEIRAIKSALKYLAGITSVSAPPGSGSTFTPGKRFTLPPHAYTDKNKAIAELEAELEQLQDKRVKTAADTQEIADIKAALQYLAGISSISAPPGSSSSFAPGKRQNLGLGDGVGSYASECPDLDGAELALEALMHEDDHPSVEEYMVMQKLRHFLNGCGVTVIKSPDGTTTTIKPSDRRDTSPAPAPVFAMPTQSPGFDLAGLEKAYESLLQSVGATKPSFSTWLAMQHLADLLEVYGISADRSPVGKRTPQSSGSGGTITIGAKACQLSDVMGLRAALAALQTAYGDPAKAPSNIFLIEQVIVTALQICGQGVSGWTTLTPGNPIPGQPITPDPTTPGAPIKPSNKIRQAPVSDPAALLAALTLLEQKYGTYGSGTIPVPIFLIMESMVTVLQDIPGVSVPGWPVLGQGSVTLTPST